MLFLNFCNKIVYHQTRDLIFLNECKIVSGDKIMLVLPPINSQEERKDYGK